MPNPYIIYTLIDDDKYHKFILEQIFQIEKGSKLTGKGRLSFDQAMQVITNKYKEGEFVDIEIKDEDRDDDEDEDKIQVILESDIDSDIDEPYFIEAKDNSNISDINKKNEQQLINKENLDVIVILSSSVAKNFIVDADILKSHITEVIIISDDGSNKQAQNLDNCTKKNLKISYVGTNELISYLNALLNDEFPYRGVEINGIDIQQEVNGELLGNDNEALKNIE